MEEIIGGAVKQSHGTLGQRVLAVQIESGVTLVECDAVLIERVLVNLLENAGKYTPPQTPVEILVRVGNGELMVSVRDHGPGVAEGQQELIFEKFTRGQAESATPGVGLGLAICRAIVEAHRGRIWVEQTHPHGATFTFSLPLGTPPVIDLSDDGLPIAPKPES
jgi:two-component system sensor histidine kinase KdpD